MSKQSKDIDRLYKFFDWDTLQHIKPRDSHKSFYSKARQVSNEAGEHLTNCDDCGGYIDKRDAINDGDCIRCPRCYEKRVEAIA